MKKGVYVSIISGLTLFLFALTGLSFAQQIKPIKPQIPAKTYYCAKVEDVLINPSSFSTADMISVGVRVRFTKQTYILGAPGQKLCNCAFEGPSGEPAKFWSKTMSLRLIGIKYSETETNLLEYGGPTPSFPPHSYSGFPVIGFTITEADLREGIKDVWGWAPKKNPLKDNREFKIYVTLDVNGYILKRDDDPDYLKKGCFPSGDFVKSFKPLYKVSIPKDGIIKKGSRVYLPPDKFYVKRLPPIKFKPFTIEDFKDRIKPDQKWILLKNKRQIDIETFLNQVNKLEEELNKSGYSLRDDKPIEIKFKYGEKELKIHKEMLSKDVLKEVHIPKTHQITCEGYSEGKSADSGRPKDFVPLNWDKIWDGKFGNDDFGVAFKTGIRVSGDENRLAIRPLFDTQISFFGQSANLLKIEDKTCSINDNKICLVGTLLDQEVFKQRPEFKFHGDLLPKQWTSFQWSIPEFCFVPTPLPIEICGEFWFEGEAHVWIDGKFDALDGEVLGSISPQLTASAFGELGVSYEIVEVGIGGNLTLIDDKAKLSASLKLDNTPDGRYFTFSAEGTNSAKILSGSLYVYGEIDALLYSKKFEIELFNFDGFKFDQTLFSIERTIAAERDHKAYLKISKISGITPYTARNEKLDIEPISYELIVDIDGRTYTKTLKDYNKDGIYGNALGEYDVQEFEIPLLSFKKVPIIIEVIERYKIGALELKNTLDFAPGVWNKVELCYDPGTRTFSGTKTGKEDEEITTDGDTSYWGERHHGIRFEIGPLHLKLAPAKAK